jgi:hydroxyacylglutathione hydrolase
MLLRLIYDDKLAQASYLLGCQRTGEALVVDANRDVEQYVSLAKREGLRITHVTETHIHADYLSGSRELARCTGAQMYLSKEGGPGWSYAFPEIDKVQLVGDGSRFKVGNITVEVMHTPGHTPEHICFLITDSASADRPIGLFSGDFVFVGDVGRPDLLEKAAGVAGTMEAGARDLYRSLQGFRSLPDYLQVWPGHGAGSACGKALGAVPTTTVGYERRFSPALAAVGAGEAEFVDFILAGQPEPPLYFARMKRLNKEGPPVLGALPTPRRLAAAELAALAGADGPVVLDLRRDRAAFFARHLRGALFAPFNRTFPTIAGSYVEPELEIVLVAAEADLDEAVRNLLRVGLDRVAGWAPIEAVDELPPAAAAAIPVVDFAREFEARRRAPGAAVLDVRGSSEFAAGHVPGAVQIAHARLAAELARVPAGDPLLVHCESGARSASAASLLARHGFPVVAVEGRFFDWQPAA